MSCARSGEPTRRQRGARCPSFKYLLAAVSCWAISFDTGHGSPPRVKPPQPSGSSSDCQSTVFQDLFASTINCPHAARDVRSPLCGGSGGDVAILERSEIFRSRHSRCIAKFHAREL